MVEIATTITALFGKADSALWILVARSPMATDELARGGEYTQPQEQWTKPQAVSRTACNSLPDVSVQVTWSENTEMSLHHLLLIMKQTPPPSRFLEESADLSFLKTVKPGGVTAESGLSGLSQVSVKGQHRRIPQLSIGIMYSELMTRGRYMGGYV